MNGRLGGIKKTYILRATAILSLLIFVLGSSLIIYFLKIPDLWFYNFCIAIGFFEISKGFLFKLDSSIYLGSLLFLIGVSGYLFWITDSIDYAIFYIASDVSIASLIAFVFTKQRFHLVFAFSIFFVEIFGILLKKSLINLPIFVAFVGSFLLLLILEIIIFFKRRR